MANLNLEWFQLSFYACIDCKISKIDVSSRKNFKLKLGYFPAASEKNCGILGIFQLLCWPVMMSAVIW